MPEQVFEDPCPGVAEVESLQTAESPAALRERERRMALWAQLIEAGGPLGIPGALLKTLGIYKGYQGIYYDSVRTSSIAPEGVTVSVIHTGTSYADDLCDDGVLYHYPDTDRPPGRDRNEIEATKNALRFGLPIFVITNGEGGGRDVHRGWVEGWSDEANWFLISFTETPTLPDTLNPADQLPDFQLRETAKASLTLAATRPGQHRFKHFVFQRYGIQCAMCGVASKELLDAAHLCPKRLGGSDDPRNGLVLCANHHRALDRGLVRIDPHTLEIQPIGDAAEILGIDRCDLTHLPSFPHPDALRWLAENTAT